MQDATTRQSFLADNWPLVVLPVVKLLVHLFTIHGYGFFRDEFYYVACSERLAFGYVDQPPLSIVLLAGIRIFGDSIWVIRLLPAVAGSLTVLLVGLMTRGMGGRHFAQILAMMAAIAAPVYLALNHFYSMNAFEILFWATAAFVLMRRLRGGDVRLWLWLGVIFGLGLQNKISVLWLGFGVVLGLVLSPRRRDLMTPWPWLGGAIAFAIFLPHILWQVGNDWPTIEFIRNATQSKMVSVDAWSFFKEQLMIMNPAVSFLWIAGLVWLFVAPVARPFRMLAWVYVAVFVLLAVNGSSRAGYLSPAYTWLFAAGAVAFERGFARLGWGWLKPLVALHVAVSAAVVAPFGMPVLPVESYIAYAAKVGIGPSTAERKELAELPQFYADMHGWESIVATVAGVCDGLTPEERAKTVIYVQNYGVAGALEFFGPRYNLPPVLCGHNNYWLWGYGDRAYDTVVIVGGYAEDHEANLESVERVTETDCGYCMPYENHNPVFVGRGLKSTPAEIWPHVRHYD